MPNERAGDSQYGSTKKYATWISEELGADLFDRKNVAPSQINAYDVVVYGGGLYAGGISGVKLVTKNPPKNLVVFTVGLANPTTTDYSEILKKNFDPTQFKDIKVFHLRGSIDYKKLSPIHRIMMFMMKKFVMDKKTPDKRTDEDRAFLETYGGHVDFTERSAIKPLIDYIRTEYKECGVK